MYTRKCPNCNKIINYTFKRSLDRANKRNAICRHCFENKPQLLTRLCPQCNKEIKHKHHWVRNKLDKEQRLCKECSNKNKTLSLQNKWSKDFDCCIHCGTTIKKHRAEGMCDQCYNRYSIKRRIDIMYARAKRRSKDFNRTICSKNDFIVHAYNNINIIKELHSNWIDSGFSNTMVPSVDRINNDLGYFPNNIQFITKSDNCKKRNH
jgi:hypothetical protein